MRQLIVENYGFVFGSVLILKNILHSYQNFSQSQT